MRTPAIMKRKLFGTKPVVFIFLLFSVFSLSAQVPAVDLGIFLSTTPDDQVEIRMKPNFDILATDIIAEIKYTICWTEPTINITPGPGIAPFNIAVLPLPYVGPVLDNGTYYWTFSSLPGTPVGFPIATGEEVVIATFECTASTVSTVKLINDSFTLANNWDYYYELQRLGDPLWEIDVTGIFYEDTVEIVPDQTVPLSNWPIYLTVLLMVGSVAVLVRKFR